MKKEFKEHKQRNEGIDREVEMYDFQIRAIFWQILIVMFLSFSAIFAGLLDFYFFVGCSISVMVIAIIMLRDYWNVRLSVIARGLKIPLSDYKKLRKLKQQKKDIEAETFLEHVTLQRLEREKREEETHIAQVDLLVKLGILMKEKNMSRAEVAKVTDKYNLPKNIYDMTPYQLKIVIGELENMPTSKTKTFGVAGI